MCMSRYRACDRRGIFRWRFDTYLGSLFKFTVYYAEVLQERGSAPVRRSTGMGSGMLHRD